jgi:hypothetical protein
MAHPQSNRSQKNLRRAPRRRLHYPAWIDLGEGSARRNCMIWDISEVGAKLTVDTQVEIPDEFTLVLSALAEEGRPCRVVWRSKQQIGIQILKGAKSLKGPKPGLAAAEAETSASEKAHLDC